MSSMSRSHWWYCICFKKKSRAKILQPGLEFANFKHPPWNLKANLFKCISWLYGSFLEDNDLGFSERRSQDQLNVTNVASYLANVFLSSHLYSMEGIYLSHGLIPRHDCEKFAVQSEHQFLNFLLWGLNATITLWILQLILVRPPTDEKKSQILIDSRGWAITLRIKRPSRGQGITENRNLDLKTFVWIELL